jgi:hypothetical protein
MWQAIAEVLFRRAAYAVLREQTRAHLEQAKGTHIAVFEHVEVVYRPSLGAVIGMTLRLMTPFILLLGLPLYLLGTNDMRTLVLVFFPLLAVLFFLVLLFDNPHYRMGGISRLEDARHRREDNNRLYVLEEGLFGIVSRRWPEFLAVELVGEYVVSLKMSTRILKRLQFRFQTTTDAKIFVEHAKSKIQSQP